MKTKVTFAQVLSVAQSRLLCEMEQVYEIFDALAGPGVTTLAIAYLGKPMREVMQKLMPWTADAKLLKAIEELEPCTETTVREHILPLCPAEFFEVEHLGEAAVANLGEGYGAYLDDVLGGKPRYRRRY